MKRLSAILSAAVMTALLLCGCGEKSSAGDELSTMASEVKGDFDRMVDNGTVSDSDGYIGDHDRAAERVTERPSERPDRIKVTEPTVGMTEPSDATEAERFI